MILRVCSGVIRPEDYSLIRTMLIKLKVTYAISNCVHFACWITRRKTHISPKWFNLQLSYTGQDSGEWVQSKAFHREIKLLLTCKLMMALINPAIVCNKQLNFIHHLRLNCPQ